MAGVKILYVEDELFLGKIVKESLESRSYQVIMEADGHRALPSPLPQGNALPASPLAANVVATKIKDLLFTTAPSYPALKYLVIIGDDRVVPHARLRDDALVANERNYAAIAASHASCAATCWA